MKEISWRSADPKQSINLLAKAKEKMAMVIANETNLDIVVKQGQKIADLFEPETIMKSSAKTKLHQ